MEHLHLILFTIMLAAAATLILAAIVDYNLADRIEKEANDDQRN